MSPKLYRSAPPGATRTVHPPGWGVGRVDPRDAADGPSGRFGQGRGGGGVHGAQVDVEQRLVLVPLVLI